MDVVFVSSPSGVVSEDTRKLQIAINSLPNKGGTVVLPLNADYTINATILLRDNVTLEGNNCKLIANNSLNTDILRNQFPSTGNHSITIRNLRIDGNRSNQAHNTNPAHAIAFYSSHNILIENVNITNIELDGIYIGGQIGSNISGFIISTYCSNYLIRNSTITQCYRNGISLTNSRHVEISGINADDNNKGVSSNSARYLASSFDIETNDVLDYCFDIVIKNCNVSSTQAPSLSIQGDVNNSNIIFKNNQINQNSSFGISTFTRADNIEITGNTINTTNAGGIWSNGQSSSNLLTNANIHNNTIYGNDSLVGVVGIGLVYTDDSVVNQNNIIDFDNAMLIDHCNTISVTSNTFTSCADDIDISNSTNITQSGNIVN